MENPVKNTSKKNQRIAKDKTSYVYDTGNYTKYPTNIFSAYKKPSVEKIKAFEYCENLCKELDGFNLVIPCHGVQTFSVTFEYADKDTGVICRAYITRDYDRFCEA